MEKTAGAEETSAELHFQLSSRDRKRILAELQREDLHVNEAARRLEMSATEALRQFQRLTEAGLLEKMPDGRYQLTKYGKLVLESSSALEFVSRHEEYFRIHDAFVLPHELRARLGALSECKLVTTDAEMLNLATETIRTADSKIDATVRGLEIILDVAKERLHDGIKERWLMNEAFLTRARTYLQSTKPLPEMRSTPKLRVEMVLTEKMAGVQLPLNNGVISPYAFFGTDSRFLRWMEDLFNDQWGVAKIWYP